MNPIYSACPRRARVPVVYRIARDAARSAEDIEAARINLGGDDLCKRLTNLRVIRRHPSRESASDVSIRRFSRLILRYPYVCFRIDRWQCARRSPMRIL